VYSILNARGDVARQELAETVKKVLPGEEGEKIMQTVADQLREEGREEGRQEGAAETARQDVLEVLETRFGPVPETLRKRIQRVEDLGVLRRLHKAAVITPSIEAFQETH